MEGNFEKSIQDLSKLLEIEPKNTQAKKELDQVKDARRGSQKQMTGQYKESSHYRSEGLKIEPSSSSAKEGLDLGKEAERGDEKKDEMYSSRSDLQYNRGSTTMQSTTMQSPHQARGTFDHLGGELRIAHYDVTVSIPPGALAEGSKHEISIEMLTRLPDDLKLKDDEMMVNFGLHCTPPGLRFRKHITVSMPHCAIFTDPESVESVVFTRSDKSNSSWYHDDTTKCHFSKDRVELRLTHFSWIWNWVKSWFVVAKRVCFVPFIESHLPRDRIPILRLRLFDYLQGKCESIKQEEEETWKMRQVSPADVLHVSAIVEDDLTLTCTVDRELKPTTQHNSRVVNYCDLRTLVTRCEIFTIDLTKHKADTCLKLLLKQESTRHVVFRTGYTDDADSITSTSTSLASSTPSTNTSPSKTLESPETECVTDDELNELSDALPPNKTFYRFCKKLNDTTFHEAEKLLEKYNKDYSLATRKALADWQVRTDGRRGDLCDVLEKVDAGGMKIVKEYKLRQKRNITEQ